MTNCENSNGIIHISKWAVTSRKGTKVYKSFLQDNFEKINKEISLLRLDAGMNIKLYFDYESRRWISKSEFIELHDLVSGNVSEIQVWLKSIFEKWHKNPFYCSLVTDEWHASIVPWYCGMLKQFIPDSDNESMFLRHSSAEHFIHGDFTLANVKIKSSGEIIVLDFENATLGPMKWDETTLVYSLIEAEAYAMARQLYESFSCSADMLKAIASVRLAQTRKKGQDETRRMSAFHFIFKYYTK